MSSKSRLLGYVSIGCGVVSFLGIFFLVFLAIIFSFVFDPKSWNPDSLKYYFYFTTFLNFCILCISFAGIISGTIGVFLKSHDTFLAAIGIGLNILPFLGELVYFCFLVAGYLFAESAKPSMPSLPSNFPNFKR